MLKDLLEPEMLELIKEKDWRQLKEVLSYWPAPDIADLLESLKGEDMVMLFRLLSSQLATEVFSELEAEKGMYLLQQLGSERVREIVSELSPDDRTSLFEELPGDVVQKLLNLLSPEERKKSLELLGYPEESVGRLMTPGYVAIRHDWTIQQALEHVRRHGHDAETINMIYVVDEKSHLIDDVPLRRLILAEPQMKVESIMDRTFVSIGVLEDQEKAANLMKRYDLIALPVVDSQNVLVGLVTVDDIMDVLEDETTEDMHKGASILPLERSYSTAPILLLFRKRVLWLLLLAIAGFLSGNVIAAFEETLGKVIALAFFIPVLIDTGGNTGAQSATLIIRAMAIGELTPKKWFSIVRKEVWVGVLLGIALGIVLYLWSYLWKGMMGVGLVVGLSVVLIAIWANLFGSMLPIVLSKLKLDPAIVSSPLITTVMDVTGLLIYFTVASWIL